MKIGFIYDSSFHIMDAFQINLSESQYAVSFLAIELAKIGNDITLFTRSANNTTTYGVRCRSLSIVDQALQLDEAILEPDFDILIVVNNAPEFVAALRQTLPYSPKMLLWIDYTGSDPLSNGLDNSEIVAQLDGIVCVSNWQRTGLISKYMLPKEKVAVRYHAIAPFFENLFIEGKEFIDSKSKTPVLAYTANPNSGLDIILDGFADVLNNYPDSMLDIYTDLVQSEFDGDKAEKMQHQVKSIPRIRAFGSVPKIKLPSLLRTNTIWVYPSTIDETNCVPLMEAQAAGLYVVTSNIGGLPEYCTEHGKCVAEANLRSDSLDSYIGQLLGICQSQLHTSATFYDYCYKQAVDLNRKHTWAVRAREWLNMLNIVLGKRKNA